MITSPRNRRVAKAVRLKKRSLREADRRFLVEGVRGVLEALDSGTPVEEVFHSNLAPQALAQARDAASRAGVEVQEVSSEVMGRLTSTVTPQGVVAVVPFVDVGLDDVRPDASCVLVLVQVRDPGNAGTILRSADASGAAAVVFTRASVDLYNPKAVRASAGSLFHVPVVRDVSLEETVRSLRSRGLAVFAASADGDIPIRDADLSSPAAILLGNEAHGLGPDAVELADASLRVPISGRVESLNLAAAAAVILFEGARQRGGDDPLARIVAGAAHDLRSPLSALRGFASTLTSRWGQLSDDQRLMMLEGITLDASRMDVIVAQLVDAARMASHNLRLQQAPVDLSEVAGGLRDAKTLWSQVEIEVSGPPVVAWVDQARLRSMLSAMVEAAEWWGEEGPVRVETRAGPRPSVVVSRRNTSLDQAAADRLLESRMPGGRGGSKVGLFVARNLARAHGGELEVQVDEAIRFRLVLPPPGQG